MIVIATAATTAAAAAAAVCDNENIDYDNDDYCDLL